MTSFPASASLFVFTSLAILLSIYVKGVLRWRARARGLALPPGPTPLPIVGNLFDIPKHKPWRGYLEFSTKYGELVYMHVLGAPILVVSSAKAADELLNKRSANTPDRPLNPVIKLSGQDLNFAITPYGQWWRRQRRAFWQQFHPGTITKYFPVQRAWAHKFLASLPASAPSQIRERIRYTFQGAILESVYGVVVQDQNDARLSIASAALEAIVLSTPGHFAVEVFPFLRHLPAWFPGAGFQKIFARCKVANDRLKHELFNEVQAGLARGEQYSCVASELIQRMNSDNIPQLLHEEEEIAKNVCAVAVEGMSPLTGFTLEGFLVAMTLFPDVQKKAQAELDAVVGPGRLPDHSDSDRLPYLNALIKETLRWHVAFPVGVAHRTLQDDELDGYFIPAGTTVITNIWGILHDSQVYEDPFVFRPERFLGKDDVLDPLNLMFGFGRRICAGRFLALPSLFINIASLLHVFDIRAPLDEDGRPVHVVYEEAHGLTSSPEECQCTFTPRSPEAEALLSAIRQTAQ
ncbi:cytochrome P450 [Lenzites betulinus]|nr:cytochrome P450 [Lenzites betulinus]